MSVISSTTMTVSTVTASDLAPVVRHAPDAQPRRQDVHQLVDQQAGQQRRQQMSAITTSSSTTAGENPRCDLVACGR